MRNREADHIPSRARTFIRSSVRTELALARMYGTSVATIRRIRASAQGNIRMELLGAGAGGGGGMAGPMSGKVMRTLAEANPVKPVNHDKLASLHVEGGPDLPLPLR